MKGWIVLLAVLALGACGERAGKDAAAPPQVRGQNEIVFPAGSPQLAAIVSAPVEPRRDMTLRFNGRLVWNEERTARVFVPFSGRVRSIPVRPGDQVRAGQTLAVLSSPEFGMAQAEARKAEQDDALARKSLARVEELQKAGIAPLKDLQAAQAEAARAASERARAQARLKLYGNDQTADQELALRSPISGVVVERNLNPGQELRSDTQGDRPVFVVSDPTHLWFMLDVSEKDVGYVKRGEEVRIGCTALGEERVTGRIVHVADLVDPQTRTVKVRGDIDKADERLKAEMYIVAKLRIPETTGFLVPAQAVYLRGEQYFVFVDLGNGRYQRRAVVPGPVSDTQQVLLKGVAEGERVVLDGNLLLERLLASKS